jgi:hypothetical protein
MLRVIRRAMSDRDTLLVAETMIPAGNGRTTPSWTMWRCS